MVEPHILLLFSSSSITINLSNTYPSSLLWLINHHQPFNHISFFSSLAHQSPSTFQPHILLLFSGSSITINLSTTYPSSLLWLINHHQPFNHISFFSSLAHQSPSTFQPHILLLFSGSSITINLSTTYHSSLLWLINHHQPVNHISFFSSLAHQSPSTFQPHILLLFSGSSITINLSTTYLSSLIWLINHHQPFKPHILLLFSGSSITVNLSTTYPSSLLWLINHRQPFNHISFFSSLVHQSPSTFQPHILLLFSSLAHQSPSTFQPHILLLFSGSSITVNLSTTYHSSLLWLINHHQPFNHISFFSSLAHQSPSTFQPHILLLFSGSSITINLSTTYPSSLLWLINHHQPFNLISFFSSLAHQSPSTFQPHILLLFSGSSITVNLSTTYPSSLLWLINHRQPFNHISFFSSLAHQSPSTFQPHILLLFSGSSITINLSTTYPSSLLWLINHHQPFNHISFFSSLAHQSPSTFQPHILLLFSGSSITINLSTTYPSSLLWLINHHQPFNHISFFSSLAHQSPSTCQPHILLLFSGSSITINLSTTYPSSLLWLINHHQPFNHISFFSSLAHQSPSTFQPHILLLFSGSSITINLSTTYPSSLLWLINHHQPFNHISFFSSLAHQSLSTFQPHILLLFSGSSITINLSTTYPSSLLWLINHHQPFNHISFFSSLAHQSPSTFQPHILLLFSGSSITINLSTTYPSSLLWLINHHQPFNHISFFSSLAHQSPSTFQPHIILLFSGSSITTNLSTTYPSSLLWLINHHQPVNHISFFSSLAHQSPSTFQPHILLLFSGSSITINLSTTYLSSLLWLINHHQPFKPHILLLFSGSSITVNLSTTYPSSLLWLINHRQPFNHISFFSSLAHQSPSTFQPHILLLFSSLAHQSPSTFQPHILLLFSGSSITINLSTTYPSSLLWLINHHQPFNHISFFSSLAHQSPSTFQPHILLLFSGSSITINLSTTYPSSLLWLINHHQPFNHISFFSSLAHQSPSTFQPHILLLFSGSSITTNLSTTYPSSLLWLINHHQPVNHISFFSSLAHQSPSTFQPHILLLFSGSSITINLSTTYLSSLLWLINHHQPFKPHILLLFSGSSITVNLSTTYPSSLLWLINHRQPFNHISIFSSLAHQSPSTFQPHILLLFSSPAHQSPSTFQPHILLLFSGSSITINLSTTYSSSLLWLINHHQPFNHISFFSSLAHQSPSTFQPHILLLFSGSSITINLSTTYPSSLLWLINHHQPFK